MYLFEQCYRCEKSTPLFIVHRHRNWGALNGLRWRKSLAYCGRVTRLVFLVSWFKSRLHGYSGPVDRCTAGGGSAERRVGWNMICFQVRLTPSPTHAFIQPPTTIKLLPSCMICTTSQQKLSTCAHLTGAQTHERTDLQYKTLHSVHLDMQAEHCCTPLILYIAKYTLHIVHWILHTAKYTLQSTHCILHGFKERRLTLYELPPPPQQVGKPPHPNWFLQTYIFAPFLYNDLVRQ